MTPTESVLIATWIASAAATVFGVLGFFVGLAGLRHARQAKEAAASANLIAKDSNAIATRANTLSHESNDIAREANQFAKFEESRATEQHDVTWDCRWVKPGVYAVKNEGKDDALRVQIQITVDDEIVEADFDAIAGGKTILLDLPRSRAVWEAEQAAEVAERRRREAAQRPFGTLGILGEGINMFPSIPTHFIRDRVLWRTVLGTPKVHDESSGMNSLAP